MTPHFLQQLRFHLGNFETEARDEIDRFLAHVEQHFQPPVPAVPGPVVEPAPAAGVGVASTEPAPELEPAPQPETTTQEATPAATEADTTPPAQEQSHG